MDPKTPTEDPDYIAPYDPGIEPDEDQDHEGVTDARDREDSSG